MLQLHYFPGNASLVSHIALEEIGSPFALRLVDRAHGEHKSAAYLALNPNGLIPVLVDGDLVLYETSAVLMHLADTHPEAGLLPTLATPERAHAYKWLAWLGGTVHAALIIYFYPERWSDGAAGAAVVKAHAEAKVGAMLEQIDVQLARHAGLWLLGDDYSAADVYAFVLCRWTRGFARPARSLPHIGPWLDRMLARPAVQRAFATEKLAPPLV